MIRERVIVRELPDGERNAFASVAALALVRGRAFVHHRTWKNAVLVCEPGRKARVTSRVDYASYLRNNALDDLAREVLRTRVADHELLAVILTENTISIIVANLRGAFA